MNRKNFHRMPKPREAVLAFLKAESEKGHKVYWDKGHINTGTNGDSHNQPGVGIYCVSCKARDQYDEAYAYETSRYMLLKSDLDVEELFTYYEANE